nr:hypothetical protein [Tanacetum cinerariifolium]
PRTVRPTRKCTYKDYLNCGPLKFNGTEGVIGLTRCYTLRFQELTLLYWRMFPEESDEIERTGHIARDCKAKLLTPTTITITTTTTTGGPQWHIKEFPLALSVELKAGNGNVVARAYGLGTAGGNPNTDVVM